VTGTAAFSVVVPARNAAAVIDDQLAALAAQTAGARMEVVVVDNDSRDRTASRVEGWRDRLPELRIVPARERHGPAYARNVGIAAATTDRVLLCDADDRVAPTWAERLVAALDRADFVGGAISSWRGTELGAPRMVGGSGFGFLPTIATCNAALHRPVWDALGGFDESLRTGEDIDFAWRAQLEGFRFAECPGAVVDHREPMGPTRVLRVSYRYGLDQPRLFARFAPEGLRADPPRRVMGHWARTLFTVVDLARPDAAQRAWCREAGKRAGRIVGSVRQRTLYL
jgi:glycosyltransferase involved in cell wall biosynthesis